MLVGNVDGDDDVVVDSVVVDDDVVKMNVVSTLYVIATA